MTERISRSVARIGEAIASLGARRVILWGYRRQSHSHHWVMLAMQRALQYAFSQLTHPPELLWLDNKTMRSPALFDDALAISNLNLDQVDLGLPLRRRGVYLIHDHAPGRSDASRYEALRGAGKAVFFEVFRKHLGAPFQPLAGKPLSYINEAGDRAVILWATDLLPYEIAESREKLVDLAASSHPNVVFVGSAWRVNAPDLAELARACVKRGIGFAHYGRVMADIAWPDSKLVQVHDRSISIDEHIQRIREATLAPALQGVEQFYFPPGRAEGQGNYVPCRIFKNVSYGAFALSNNPTTEEVFGDAVTCRADIGDLLDAGLQQAKDDRTRSQLADTMTLVADKHTYLNRLATLFELTVAQRQRSGNQIADFDEDTRMSIAMRRLAGIRARKR